VDTTTLTFLLGLVLPPLIALLKRQHYPQTFNAVIALVVYAVAGVGSVIASGQSINLNDPNNVLQAIGVVTTAGTIAYQAFWRNWGDPQIAALLASPTASAAVPVAETPPASI
jgi:CHASE2 domain-containing sensor protein